MKYYLLDTSAVIHYYIPSRLTSKINKLVEQRQKLQSFLFIPIFCIAETYNTFAKYYYREKELTPSQYRQIYEKFTEDIHRGKLFYQVELNQWHVMNIDFISPFEHTLFTTRENQQGEEENWYLSTFDILLISTGIELAKILTQDNLILLTCDKRIVTIGKSLQMISKKNLKEHNIPKDIPFPKVEDLNSFKI